MRSAFGVISVGRWRLPRCQATRISARRVGGADLGERLGRGDHLDDPAVLEPQPVAAAQHRRLGEVEQEGEAADAGHDEAAAIALVEVEHDAVDRRPRPSPAGTTLSARSIVRSS